MNDHQRPSDRRGPIVWMASNPVAANLLMLFLLVGGLYTATQVTQEVFPEIDLDVITVTVPYPGAAPTEVEQGIVLAVEEAVRGLDGVREVRATASEGMAFVAIELFTFADADEVLNDVDNAIDRIASFPQDAEEPIVQLATTRLEVISLIVYGDLTLDRLKQLAEQIRRDLLRRENITLVEIQGLPPPEISIEIPQENLRRYGLTLPQIAGIVREASVELPAGSIETRNQEILVRVTERRERGDEYRDIAVVTTPEGNRVTLGAIATIIDGFEDVDQRSYFNGLPAARIQVFRVGDQTPVTIAESVKEYRDELAAGLPDQVQVTTWNDTSEVYWDRVSLLMENGQLGALLVLIVLGLFLKPRVAFWVTVGIPVAFLGAFLFMPAFDVSINMISLFAFLLVLGIVVDDAIVVGEATYHQMDEGKRPLDAAVAGVNEVIQPVTFAVLTTIIAFTPLLFVPGTAGEFFRNIPLIVMPILFLSLVESFVILPAHLGHPKYFVGRGRKAGAKPRWYNKPAEYQQRFSRGVERLVRTRYCPFIETAIKFRYLTLAIAVAVLAIAFSLPAGGYIPFNFFPRVQGDIVSAEITLPVGSASEETQQVLEQVIEAGRTVLQQVTEQEARADPEFSGNLSEGILANLGTTATLNPIESAAGGGSANVGSVQIALVSAGERSISARQFSELWRRETGTVPGVDNLTFNYSIGPSAGAKVAIELAHDDRATLERAAAELAAQLGDYAGVSDIDDGFTSGKEEIRLRLKPAARILGVTETDLARQVRGAFFGIEALREQRGRDELRVYVRLPEWQTDSEYAIEQLIIQTPEGGQMTLRQAAYIERGTSFTEITREDARRVVEVTADVDPAVITGGEVTANLEQNYLPELMERFPGLSHELAGEQQEQARTMESLGRSMLLALFAMYTLMAVSFRSYAQPLIVLAAIPFGMIGALLGHLLMGFDLSLVSVLGLVALMGVVVNDSLVLVTAVNDQRRGGASIHDAVVNGTLRRFRPVLLTSLTTFFGLAPMIFETSLQARFLIPMALSLGFGVLLVTPIVLILVPVLYYALEDLKQLSREGNRGPVEA